MPSTVPDEQRVGSIHHVTGIVGEAQVAVGFYTGVLGLRLLRTTVNFEDVLQHHLYFGVDVGRPGTVFTVFPDPHGDPGRAGRPGYEAVAFEIPSGAVGYWRQRLNALDCDVHAVDPSSRFGDQVIRTHDPTGTTIELVARERSIRTSPVASSAASTKTSDSVPDLHATGPATDRSADELAGPVPNRHAIRGLDGVTAHPTDPYGAATVLEALGCTYKTESTDRVRYRTPGDAATVIDLVDRGGSFVREGPGTLHHVALRVPDRNALLEWHRWFRDRDVDVSRVRDRHFFHSLYVRGPGGLLVELATDRHGTTGSTVHELADSSATGHATALYLPPRFADKRELIESQLPVIAVPILPLDSIDRTTETGS